MIGIICALEIEYQAILKLMDSVEKYKYHQWDFYEGYLNGRCIVLAYGGIGKVNAALCVSIMKQKYAIDILIIPGISGILNKELEIGDLVLATETSYHDCYINPSKSNVQVNLLTDIGQRFYIEPKIIAKVESIIKKALYQTENHLIIKNIQKHPRLLIGKIITGDMPITNGLLAEKIRNDYEPLCVDMESAGIAQACNIFGIPFFVIRIMSDFANERSYINVLRYGDRLCNLLARIVTKIIQEV